MGSQDLFWKPKWVPKGTLQTKEGPRRTLEPPERAQGAQGQSVSNFLGTKKGLESPKGAQGAPKGAQRTPKGSPKGPPKSTFSEVCVAKGPFRKSWFYCINIYILARGEAQGIPKGSQKGTRRGTTGTTEPTTKQKGKQKKERRTTKPQKQKNIIQRQFLEVPFSKCTLSPRRGAIFERTQIAPRQSVSDFLCTKGGRRGAQRDPKGAQRAPKGPPRDPLRAPFWKFVLQRGPTENYGFTV
jgi:hypothetical protein